MSEGIRIDLRHGDDATRRMVRAHLASAHCTTSKDASPDAIVIDLDGCVECTCRCVAPGGVVVAGSGAGHLRVVTRVDGGRAGDIVTAVRMISSMLRVAREGGHEAADDAASTLSSREWDVALRVAAGDSNKQIARRLGVMETTVKVHMTAVMRKIGAVNRTQVALWVSRRSADAAV